MRRILTIIILIILLLSGCINNTITGTYVGNDPSSFTFYDDGTFVAEYHNGKEYSLGGTYKVNADEIVIKYDLMGAVYRLHRENNSVLVYEIEGQKWVKQ